MRAHLLQIVVRFIRRYTSSCLQERKVMFKKSRSSWYRIAFDGEVDMYTPSLLRRLYEHKFA